MLWVWTAYLYVDVYGWKKNLEFWQKQGYTDKVHHNYIKYR